MPHIAGPLLACALALNGRFRHDAPPTVTPFTGSCFVGRSRPGRVYGLRVGIIASIRAPIDNPNTTSGEARQREDDDGDCDGEEDAIRIANDSRFGLSGAVWSGDEAHTLSVARRIRTGQVDINGGAFNPCAPFGGVGCSGHGRELGAHGLEEFFYLKSIQR